MSIEQVQVIISLLDLLDEQICSAHWRSSHKNCGGDYHVQFCYPCDYASFCGRRVQIELQIQLLKNMVAV